mgnify:CR=1 FL=1
MRRLFQLPGRNKDSIPLTKHSLNVNNMEKHHNFNDQERVVFGSGYGKL